MTEKSRLRLLVLQVLVLALLGTLVGRLWYLQVVNGAQYTAAVTYNATRDVVVPAPRGEVVDAAGRPLVTNRTALVVTVDWQVLQKEKDKGAAVYARLAKILGTTPDLLAQKVEPCYEAKKSRPTDLKFCWTGSPYQPVPVSDTASTDQALQILEQQEQFPGVSAQVQAVRTYPQPVGANAASVLGYTAPISGDEVAKLPKADQAEHLNDYVGRGGLEEQYNAQLSGTAGVQTLRVDQAGNVLGTAATTTPAPGANLVTSIDANVQKALEDALAFGVQQARTNPVNGGRGVNADTATGTVFDTQTGRIVAMASYPSYDPSIWVNGVSNAQFQALQNDPTNPLLNKAIAGVYPPGSSWKPYSTAALVQSGEYSFNSSYACPGSVQVGNRAFTNYEGYPYGSLSLHDILVISCDTNFYQQAKVDWAADEALVKAGQQPKESVARIAQQLGFGSRTGVDLPGESTGILQTRESKKSDWAGYWKDQYCKGKDNPAYDAPRRAFDAYQCQYGYIYQIGEQAQFYIGQTTVGITTIQSAAAIASYVNGGNLFSPRLGWALVDSTGKVLQTIPVPVRAQSPISPTVRAQVIQAMCDMPKDPRGTASGVFKGFDFTKVTVCAKTGTAETSSDATVKTKDDAWFVSLAGWTGQTPRYAVAITTHYGGLGAIGAGTAARHFYEALFGLNGQNNGQPLQPGGVPPAQPPSIAASTLGPAGPATPATPAAHALGVPFAPDGAGSAAGAPALAAEPARRAGVGSLLGRAP